MPSFSVETPRRSYFAVVERGVLARLADYVPPSASKVFVVTTPDVWRLHGEKVERALAQWSCHVLLFPGGEERKRLASLEELADRMVSLGGDRSSLVVAFGGGIVTDLAGFLAAVFMRGIPVVQAPTTLLAQVDAGVGGKTGVNLLGGKNLIGAFHQPLAALIDPEVLSTLPAREYRAGLFEVLKCGVIRSEPLFRLMAGRSAEVLARAPELVDRMLAESVRIKAEVVSADEREGDLRRILNFGHTVGHALEAETAYARFLHGEAVAFGMKAAAHLATLAGLLAAGERDEIVRATELYGPIPPLEGVSAARLAARLTSDKKTVRGQVHFVLPERIGWVRVVSGLDAALVLEAIQAALG